MKKFRVVAYAEVEVVTLVEANNEKEAEKEVLDRDISLCIHGSELADNCLCDQEFTLTDGTHNGILKIGEIEEYSE